MPKIRVLSVASLSLLLTAYLAGADPIPKTPTILQLREIAASPETPETRRMEALRHLAERAADSEEPWSGLPFYVKLEKSADSEPLAKAALSGVLNCIKARDGLIGVRTYLRKRIRDAQSDKEKQRLEAPLDELKKTLSSLTLPKQRSPKLDGRMPIELEVSKRQPANKGIALVLSGSAEREDAHAKLKEVGIDLDSVLSDDRAGKKASMPWKAVEILLPKNTEKDRALTDILTSMLFSFCDELCAKEKYDLAAKECSSVLGSMEGPDKLKVMGKLIEIYVAKHSPVAPGLGIAEFQEWAAKLKDPQEKFYARYHVANYWYKQKIYEKAMREFEGIVKDFPEEDMLPDVQLTLALCKLNLGDLNACVELLEDIADKHPDGPIAPRAIFAAGWGYLSQQKTEEAVAKFRQLLKKYPNCEYAGRAKGFIERFGR